MSEKLVWKCERKSAGPCLPGHKGCGDRIPCLLSIRSHCYSAISLCFYVFRGPTNPQIAATRSSVSDLAFHKKSCCFHACFQGLKNQKNGLRGFQKTTKMHPKIHQKRFPRKLDFCNTFIAKTTILKS